MAAPQFDTAGLRLRVRQRADMVNSLFVTDAEVDSYVDTAFQELYGMAVAEWEDVFVQKYEVDVHSTDTSAFFVPDDFRKLRGVRVQNDRFLIPVSMRELESIDSTGGQLRRNKPRYYWLFGDANGGMTIHVLPQPDATYTMTVYYIPAVTLATVTALVAKGLTTLASWDEYVVLTAAIKCKDKEESDCSVLLQERALLLENIKKSWQPVDTAEAARVVQLNERRNAFNPYDYDPDDAYG